MQAIAHDIEARDDVTSAEDERLTDAVEQYLQELEAGKHPERGEYLARYSDIAERLRQCLEGLDLVYEVAPQLSDSGGPSPTAAPSDIQPLATLGDFRILRELGRGGMGVVYEAQQLSLGRRVALKVLPFAAMLDPRQLQRFKNEAQAAAMLRHPNIVGVHSVGCERGVHYYAMELVEGHSLAQVIESLQSRHHAPAAVGSRTTDFQVRRIYTAKGTSRDGLGSPSYADSEKLTVSPRDERPSGHLPSPTADTQPIMALSTQRDATNRHEYFRSIARGNSSRRRIGLCPSNGRRAP
jgi:hypothetical protein